MIAAGLGIAGCGGSTTTTNTPASGPTSRPAASTPATTVAPVPTTACVFPQGNGGDHDADNNGGPDDGDGCDI